MRDHVWHPYVIAGKTHWLKTLLFKCIERCLSSRAVNRLKNPNRFFTGFLTSNRFFKQVFFSGSVITKKCLRSAKILAFYAMHVHIYVCVFKCISDQAAVN